MLDLKLMELMCHLETELTVIGHLKMACTIRSLRYTGVKLGHLLRWKNIIW